MYSVKLKLIVLPMSDKLPINCAARNAVWSYDHVVEPRFAGAPQLIEKTRAHQMPDVLALVEGADVEVELFGGVVNLRLRGDVSRIYVAKYEYVGFRDEAEARLNFLELWRDVQLLRSPQEVTKAAEGWIARARQK